MHEYTLYYFPSCPYCRKVLRFMESAGITVPMKNTLQDGNDRELALLGGKNQVPALSIDGRILYESDDIIQYLKDSF